MRSSCPWEPSKALERKGAKSMKISLSRGAAVPKADSSLVVMSPAPKLVVDPPPWIDPGAPVPPRPTAPAVPAPTPPGDASSPLAPGCRALEEWGGATVAGRSGELS